MNRPNVIPLDTHEKESFLRYFQKVDQLLSERFKLGFDPNEEHITSLLCELLDKEGSKLHSLPYTLSGLNKDLNKGGNSLKADILIATNEYNKNQEGKETQSDLGIILDYKSYNNPKKKFQKGILIQAKKLFPDNKNNPKKYSLGSKYESFKYDKNKEDHQHCRLENLNKKYKDKNCGEQCINYLMYNPPLDWTLDFKLLSTIATTKLTSENNILNILKEHKTLEKLKFGCIFASVDQIREVATEAAKHSRAKTELHQFSLNELTKKVNIFEGALPYFLVCKFMTDNIGCYCEDFLELLNLDGQPSYQQIPKPKCSIKLTITSGKRQ